MNTVINVPKIFGSDVFNEATMRQRLSAPVYNAWRTCIDTGAELKLETATSITTVPYHAGAAKYYAEHGITVNTDE